MKEGGDLKREGIDDGEKQICMIEKIARLSCIPELTIRSSSRHFFSLCSASFILSPLSLIAFFAFL